MRQRLALAQALLPEPEVLLLDEPTDGLDPEGIKWFRDFILNLRDERGMTVLFNSHLLAEVELMCDRVAILREGKRVFEGTVNGLQDDDPGFRGRSRTLGHRLRHHPQHRRRSPLAPAASACRTAPIPPRSWKPSSAPASASAPSPRSAARWKISTWKSSTARRAPN